MSSRVDQGDAASQFPLDLLRRREAVTVLQREPKAKKPAGVGLSWEGQIAATAGGKVERRTPVSRIS